MATSKSEYVPGVCNIGNVEAANRRKTAMGAAIATIVVWATLILLDAPVFAYLLISLPAFVAATAYIQSRERFCAGFGAEGLYNFSDELGKTQKATKAEDLSKDKKKAISITVQSAIIGVVLAIVAGIISLAL